MSEVLVLVDHVDGTVRKSTLELLTIARRLGEPSAVFLGSGVETAREALAQYGAEKIYLVDVRRESATTWSRRRPRCWPSWSARPRRPRC